MALKKLEFTPESGNVDTYDTALIFRGLLTKSITIL